MKSIRIIESCPDSSSPLTCLSSPRRRVYPRKGIQSKITIIDFLFLFIFFFPKLTHGIDHFRTDYTVDYFLSENDNNISSRVSYKIKITNLTPDLVIKNFSILFPKAFKLATSKPPMILSQLFLWFLILIIRTLLAFPSPILLPV